MQRFHRITRNNRVLVNPVPSDRLLVGGQEKKKEETWKQWFAQYVTEKEQYATIQLELYVELAQLVMAVAERVG